VVTAGEEEKGITEGNLTKGSPETDGRGELGKARRGLFLLKVERYFTRRPRNTFLNPHEKKGGRNHDPGENDRP